jgi:hypothetical protein
LDEDPAGTYDLDLEGRVAVMVVDNSGGPEEFDPDGTIREGAKFLLSTFSDVDNVGIVTVRFPVEAIYKISHLGEEGAREKAMSSLEAMKIGGDAEYFEALKKAQELLDIFSAQRDSAIVFLTGGRKRPGGNSQEIRDLMKVFAERGWRFFPVVLTPAPDLMSALEYGAALTQGAVFKIERPSDILSSLVTVSGKVNDLWVRRRLSPAPVFDGARRLIMAVTRDDEPADLEKVTRDDSDVPIGGGDAQSVVSSPAFKTLTMADPPPGMWAALVKGTANNEAMFVKPPFKVYLDDEASVKGSALEGDEISFHIVVEGEIEDLKKWAPKGVSDITLVSETTGKAVDHFPMEKTYIAPHLRFSGKTRLFTSESGTPEIFTARVTLVFGEGDQSWVREEFLSFELKPAATHAFRVEPADLNMGIRWSDEKEISRILEIVSRVEEPVEVKADGIPEGLIVEPTTTTASLGARGSMEVALADALRMEGGKGTLSFKIQGASTSEEGISFERVVKVTYRLVKFTGPTTIELEPMAPGQGKRIPMGTWSVGGGDIPFKAETGPLEGPGLIVPTLEEEEGKQFLLVSVPENAVPGLYQGRIAIVPMERGLGSRFVPLSVKIVPRGEEVGPEAGEPALRVSPSPVELVHGATGWARSSFKVAVPKEKPPVIISGVRPSSLRGKTSFETISAQFDIRISPAPGWEGKELGSGHHAAYILEIYISSDLPDDVYEGEAQIQYRIAGRDELVEVPVPFRLTLKRSK